MSKLYEKVCINCGQTFKTHGHGALRCYECNQDKRRQYFRDRLAKQKAEKERGLNPPKTLRELTKEVEAYNKEHHTNLTYGQYVLKVEGGRTDV